MAQTEADVLATEIEKVRKKVPALFYWEEEFYSVIEKRNLEVISGRDARGPMRMSPGGRFGHFNPDGGDLGRGGAYKFDKFLIGSQYLRYTMEQNLKADWGTDDMRKAVVNTFRDNVAKAMDEFRTHANAVTQTAGQGVVATVTSVSTAGGKDTITCTTDGFNVKLLREGNFYSIFDSTLATRRTFTGGASASGYAPIDLHDLENKQARFNGTTGATVAGDKVVIDGLTATPPTSVYGIPYHHSNASTGTWLGLDRATYPQIRANRVNAGGSLALAHARLAVNKIGDRLGKKNIGKVQAWMHPAQVQAYEALGQLVSQIHKGTSDEKLNLYFGKNMQMAGVQVKEDYMWDRTRIDFVDLETWGRVETKKPDFLELSGKKFYEARSTDGGVAAAVLMYIVAGINFFIDSPPSASYIDGLTVPTGY